LYDPPLLGVVLDEPPIVEFGVMLGVVAGRCVLGLVGPALPPLPPLLNRSIVCWSSWAVSGNPCSRWNFISAVWVSGPMTPSTEPR
jgi:hypothetical protein